MLDDLKARVSCAHRGSVHLQTLEAIRFFIFLAITFNMLLCKMLIFGQNHVFLSCLFQPVRLSVLIRSPPMCEHEALR